MKYEIMNIWKTLLSKRESYHHHGNRDAREGKGKHVVKLHIPCDNFGKKNYWTAGNLGKKKGGN